jgi:hypothetical protein
MTYLLTKVNPCGSIVEEEEDKREEGEEEDEDEEGLSGG